MLCGSEQAGEDPGHDVRIAVLRPPVPRALVRWAAVPRALVRWADACRAGRRVMPGGISRQQFREPRVLASLEGVSQVGGIAPGARAAYGLVLREERGHRGEHGE